MIAGPSENRFKVSMRSKVRGFYSFNLRKELEENWN
jgi:hypothetical protein